jgi:hypothetical protein
MPDTTDPMKGEKSSPEQATEQQKAADWPKPGDEGYVHPDGTPQSQAQLAGNRRAAADRAAAGSVVHGAPLASPGPQSRDYAGVAAQRAEAYSETTTDDAVEGLTKYVREAEAPEQPGKPEQRTAAQSAPHEKR